MVNAISAADSSGSTLRAYDLRLPGSEKALIRHAKLVPAGDYLVGSREHGCYPRKMVSLQPFYIWPTEVPAAWWDAYRGDQADSAAAMPATHVSYDDAGSFCRWLSERFGVHARLPTRDEWQVAARAGKGGVTTASGWGRLNAEKRNSPVAVRDGEANPWGLFHMTGNVGEWCRADEGESEAPVMGGSWAERDSDFLRISHRLTLPKDYRDADVGFRFVFEIPGQETIAPANLHKE